MEKKIINETIEAAVQYASKGFSVIPLGPISKGTDGKKVISYPKGGWKQYQSRIASKKEIEDWDCTNLGIVTGSISNLLVLDLDSYKPGFDKNLVESFCIPITPMQQTASGGRQYFFKLQPGLVIKNGVCIGSKDSGIDIRGEGGMVIVSPSKTAYGEYRWDIGFDDEPLADVPPVLLELLTKESEGQMKEKSKLLELVGLNEGGGRNNAIASFSGKLLASTASDKWDTEVWPTVQAVNNTYKPPLGIKELESVYESIKRIERAKRQDLGTSNATAVKVPYIAAISHAELIAKEFSPARYTIAPFFEQGTMNMVSAPPNTWKSWLLFLFAYNISTGTPAFGEFSTEKAKVMIVNEEDSARLVQDRLRLLDVTEAELPIYYRIAQGSKLNDDFISELIKEAKEKEVGVIMFDSLRAVHEADENDSTAMQMVMDLLKKIVREDITVIFTHHHRKKAMFAKNDDAESSRGSSAINAAISGHISLAEISGDDNSKVLVLKHLKSKVGEKLEPIDVGIEVGEKISFHYLGSHEEKNQAENQAKNKILETLEGREELLSRKDLVYLKIAGQTTIKKALKVLVIEGKVQSVTRKEATKLGLKTLTDGKSNEALYSLISANNSEIVKSDNLFIDSDEDW